MRVKPNASQYAIMFFQSLINEFFFYFWNRSWYSGECAWRLHCIPYLGSLDFNFHLKQKKRFSVWIFIENASFISFQERIWSRYSKINNKFDISKGLSFQKWQKHTKTVNWRSEETKLNSNVNEVIRAVLNFFTKRFGAHKKAKTRHKPKPTKKARIKTSKRMKIVCFAFLRARRKENRKKRKVPRM